MFRESKAANSDVSREDRRPLLSTASHVIYVLNISSQINQGDGKAENKNPVESPLADNVLELTTIDLQDEVEIKSPQEELDLGTVLDLVTQDWQNEATPMESESKSLVESKLHTNQEKIEDLICPISLTLPLLPVRKKTGNQNYEMGVLLHMLYKFLNDPDPDIRESFYQQLEASDPLTREKFNLSNFSQQYVINKKLIAKVDRALKKYDCTRQDLLTYYKVPPELYDYLIQLKFSKKSNAVEKIKKYLNKNPSATAIFVLLAMAGVFFFYHKSLQGEMCAGSLVIDKTIYSEILKTFRSIKFIFPHPTLIWLSDMCGSMIDKGVYPNPLTSTIFSRCAELWEDERVFYSTPPGQDARSSSFHLSLKDNYGVSGSGLLLSIGFMAFTNGHLGSMVRNFLSSDRTAPHPMSNRATILMMMGVSLIGLDAVSGCFGFFNWLQAVPSARYTCIRACNDEAFETHLIKNVTYTLKFAKEEPLCHGALNLVTAGIGLLLSPFTYFGSKLIGSCRKRPASSGRELEAVRQFRALRDERGYDYINNKGPR